MGRKRLSQLRLGDIATFLAVHRFGCFTRAAQELKVTVSQVSKAMARLEGALGVTVFARGSRGVTLSGAGRRLLPHLEAVLQRLECAEDSEREAVLSLTLAGPSYVGTTLFPAVAMALPELKLRGLELPPSMIRAFAAENAFDLAVSPGLERMPPTWACERVGHLRKALFARRALAERIGGTLCAQRVREYPFVMPVYWLHGHFTAVDDDCPLPRGERKIAHEVQTFALALELAAASDNVVFGPVIAAERLVASGKLREIAVPGWNVREPLYVACHGDRVRARHRDRLVRGIAAALEAQADHGRTEGKRPEGRGHGGALHL